MFTLSLLIVALVLAAIPAGMFLVNLIIYRPPPKMPRLAMDQSPSISVLIPARNEESSIASSLQSVLSQEGANLEVVVLDDHSEDDTARIVRSFADQDQRVRLEQAPPLPPGWCGKQFACYTLAQRARYDNFLFLDADVRLLPHAVAGMLHAMECSKADLLSGIPRQLTGSFLEKLLLPLIHFVLLGFLPMPAMRQSRHPKFAAGCGQLMLTRREAYFKAKGHAAIRDSLHDGLKLPRAFRVAGAKTDLIDATPLAECRMYTSNRDTWAGLAKNATEGLAAPGVLLPMTFLMAGGQILPFVLLGFWNLIPETFRPLLFAALGCAWLPRWICCIRFHQPWLGALLHPLGILLLLGIQWQASWQRARGRHMEWKGRTYPSSANPPLPPPKKTPPLLPVIRKSLLWIAPLAILILVFGFLTAHSEESSISSSSTPPPPLSTFELTDQYGQNHKIQFPSLKPVLLLAADRKGSDHIQSWLTHIRNSYAATNRPFLLLGLADVRAVPRPLRSFIRKKFIKLHSYPVMMDWDGMVINQFQLKAQTANLFLIQSSGKVVYNTSGKATNSKWNTLKNLIAQPEKTVRNRNQ